MLKSHESIVENHRELCRMINHVVNDYITLDIDLKPWTNGVASRRKLKTWVHLRLRLARPCVHLR